MRRFRADSAYKAAAVESYHSRKVTGTKIVTIAKDFNISPETLRNWVKEAKDGTLDRPAYGEIPEAKKLKMKELFQAGFPDTVIAEKVEMRNLKVYYFRKALGITSAQIVENRYNVWEAMIKAGYSFEDVAQMYGAKANAVYKKLNHLRGVVKRAQNPQA